ncbi:hypothetical protein MMC26_002370 [Xylographa opegraphella]|nr:hypothetical protein [Xylographa opegraphella]
MRIESATVCALALADVAAATSLSSSSKLFENSINRESIKQAVGNAKVAIHNALVSSNAAASAVMSSSSEMVEKYINKETLHQAAEKARSGLDYLAGTLYGHTVLATQHGSQGLQAMKGRLAAVEFDKLPEVFKAAKEQILIIDYSVEIKDWIQQHPYQTVFYVVNGLVFVAPGLVTTPVLGLIGFGSFGPKAASAASAYQATIGNVPKGAIFALLQSAAAGGYWARTVNGIVQGAAFLGSTVMAGKGAIDSKAPLIEPETQSMDSENHRVEPQAKL